jgi:hypothetical protein
VLDELPPEVRRKLARADRQRLGECEECRQAEAKIWDNWPGRSPRRGLDRNCDSTLQRYETQVNVELTRGNHVPARLPCLGRQLRLREQLGELTPSHGENRGSSPLGSASKFKYLGGRAATQRMVSPSFLQNAASKIGRLSAIRRAPIVGSLARSLWFGFSLSFRSGRLDWPILFRHSRVRILATHPATK